MEQQVSNSTIAVLLILAIMISVVGTWTVLEKTRQKMTDQENVIETPGDMLTGNTVNNEIYNNENEKQNPEANNTQN